MESRGTWNRGICLSEKRKCRHTILRKYEFVVAAPFAWAQLCCMLHDLSACTPCTATRSTRILSLLALQFEHGTARSHLIFLLRHKSHWNDQQTAPGLWAGRVTIRHVWKSPRRATHACRHHLPSCRVRFDCLDRKKKRAERAGRVRVDLLGYLTKRQARGHELRLRPSSQPSIRILWPYDLNAVSSYLLAKLLVPRHKIFHNYFQNACACTNRSRAGFRRV